MLYGYCQYGLPGNGRCLGGPSGVHTAAQSYAYLHAQYRGWVGDVRAVFAVLSPHTHTACIIIQQTQLAHPLPSPYTEHACRRRCGGMHPRKSSRGTVGTATKSWTPWANKTFCPKNIYSGGYGPGRMRLIAPAVTSSTDDYASR